MSTKFKSYEYYEQLARSLSQRGYRLKLEPCNPSSGNRGYDYQWIRETDSGSYHAVEGVTSAMERPVALICALEQAPPLHAKF